MNNLPLVTVAISSYNGEKCLPKAIESAISQTHRNIEILIFDDASNDGSVKVIQSYASKDDRVKLVANQVNLGIIDNANFLLSQAQGEYFVLFDQDDWREPNYLEECLKIFQGDPDIVLAHSPSSVYFAGEKIHEVYFRRVSSAQTDYQRLRNLIRTRSDLTMCGLVKTSLLRQFGGWEPSAIAFNTMLFKLATVGKFGSTQYPLHSYTAKGVIGRGSFREENARHSKSEDFSNSKFFFVSQFFALEASETITTIKSQLSNYTKFRVLLMIWCNFALVSSIKIVYRALFVVSRGRLPFELERWLLRIAFPIRTQEIKFITYSFDIAYKRGWPLR
jgi:glycosyltransferase involved in cell wall biosynthesis